MNHFISEKRIIDEFRSTKMTSSKTSKTAKISMTKTISTINNFSKIKGGNHQAKDQTLIAL